MYFNTTLKMVRDICIFAVVCTIVVSHFVLRLAQEFLTCIESSSLPVKGCKISAYARCPGCLSREGYLTCPTWSYTGPRFFRSRPKDRPIYDSQGQGVQPNLLCKRIFSSATTTMAESKRTIERRSVNNKEYS
jgi:hypothetical protein